MLLSGTLRTCEWGACFFSSLFCFGLFLFLSYLPLTCLCSFDALVLRFEAPDSRNRWDSPLFTILKDDVLPCEAISDALFKRKAPPPNQSTQSVRDLLLFCFVLSLKKYYYYYTIILFHSLREMLCLYYIFNHLMILTVLCSNHCHLQTFYTSWTRLRKMY